MIACMVKNIVALAVLLLVPCLAHAQFFAKCDSSASEFSLKQSIAEHNRHVANLHDKFVTTGWYGRDKKGSSVGTVEIVDNLARLAPRRAALLFYAYEVGLGSGQGRFCTWLISPHLKKSDAGKFVAVSKELQRAEFERLQPDIVNALGVIALSHGAAPSQTGLDRESALKKARAILLPDVVLATLETEGIDTLVVLPIFDLGSIPFALLPIGKDRMLVDLVAITIAPGFFVFEHPPRPSRRYSRALVLGNPLGTTGGSVGATPQVEAEARAIAQEFGTEPEAAANVTIARITAQLGKEPGPDLVYIAAHARADGDNPLDAGYLLLDRPWTGREISKLRLGQARPLVILSACQSGLGKDFDVGSIGLARAWHQAGASNVVISLWSVYQESTAELMRDFARALNSAPADVALRKVMIGRRQALQAAHRDEPKRWAGFTVFGLPETKAKEP
jgi:CHAT domain